MKQGRVAAAEAAVSDLYLALLAIFRKFESQGCRPSRSYMGSVVSGKARDAPKGKVERVSYPDVIEDVDTLTAAELRVFRMVGMGMTNFEVAGALFISPLTVRTHVKRIHAKLNVKGRANLAVAAHRIYFGEGRGK